MWQQHVNRVGKIKAFYGAIAGGSLWLPSPRALWVAGFADTMSSR